MVPLSVARSSSGPCALLIARVQQALVALGAAVFFPRYRRQHRTRGPAVARHPNWVPGRVEERAVAEKQRGQRGPVGRSRKSAGIPIACPCAQSIRRGPSSHRRPSVHRPILFFAMLKTGTRNLLLLLPAPPLLLSAYFSRHSASPPKVTRRLHSDGKDARAELAGKLRSRRVGRPV